MSRRVYQRDDDMRVRWALDNLRFALDHLTSSGGSRKLSAPNYRPAYSVIGRLSKVALALWLIANGALLAGCAAGALTCDGATLRRGETCEVRPAFIRWTTAVPKGMR